MLDPADMSDEQGTYTVFSLGVVSDDCGSLLTITLELISGDIYFKLKGTEPGGNIVYSGGTGVRVMWHVVDVA